MPPRTTLRPDLEERHVSMMAFSACLGFGLFLQSGAAVNISGPGLAIVVFLLTCSLLWAILGCLGEMSALYPIQGPLFEFPGRFLDESVGYATGWLSWFSFCIIVPAQLRTIAQLFKFEYTPEYLREMGYPSETLKWSTWHFSPAVWIFIFWIVTGVTVSLPVRQFGRVMYVVGVVKMTFLVGVILFNIFISLVQPVQHGNRFWTWSPPWGFGTDQFILKVDDNMQPTSSIGGHAGRFVGLLTSIITIMFSLVGFETISLSAPENKNIEKHETMKIATKKLIIRLTVLYSLAVFTGGLNVPYDDPYLAQATWGSGNGGQRSVFVIAAVRNRLKGWPSFFNGMFIFSALTCGISGLYNASRLLHALASIPEAWPLWLQPTRRRLGRTTSYGVPMGALFLSWLFGFLGFLSIDADSTQVIGHLVNIFVTSSVIVYIVICLSFFRFYHRIKRAADDDTLENRSAFNRQDDNYPYRSRGQLFRAGYGLTGCVLFILTSGWRAFISPFNLENFISSYISLVAFIVIVALYHIRFDGWNPLKWRISASMEIQRPPPTVTAPGPRRGKLILPEPKSTWSEKNAKAFIDWLWIWIK